MTFERLQAVISALTSSKFYWLPPDKENPVIAMRSGLCAEVVLPLMLLCDSYM